MGVKFVFKFFVVDVFFFFQAEDGIRDLVRSRGLGDVYKRQIQCLIHTKIESHGNIIGFAGLEVHINLNLDFIAPVSYTHLTLPTNYSV